MTLRAGSFVATYGSGYRASIRRHPPFRVAAPRRPARGTDRAQRSARRARHDVGRGRDVPRTARAVRRGCGRIAPSILRPRGRHRDHLRGRQGVRGWEKRSLRGGCVRSRRDRPRPARPHPIRAPRLVPRPSPSLTSIPARRRPLRAGKTQPPRDGYHPKKMIEGVYAGYTIRYPGTSPTRRSRARRPARRSPRPSARSPARALDVPPPRPPRYVRVTRPASPPFVRLDRSLRPQCLTATRRKATPR